MTVVEKYQNYFEVTKKLKPEQRKELSADYIQRYCKEIMNEEELATYKFNKTMFSFFSTSFTVVLPF